MEKTSNKLQVEILSPSNVLSNFAGGITNNKVNSYLSSKNTTPLNYELSKFPSSTVYTSPKSMLSGKPLEDSKTRGFSLEQGALISSNKKETDSVYFLKSPLLSTTDTKKNFSFNNFMTENQTRKMDFEQKHMKSVKVETNSNNFKLVRNNSMNKMGNKSITDTIESQKNTIRKVMGAQNAELNVYTPKTYLFNNNNNVNSNNNANSFSTNPHATRTDLGMNLSPKQKKLEKVYEQIKLFQSNRKKNEEGNRNLLNSEEKKPICEKKESFVKVLNETSNTMNSLKIQSTKNELQSKMKMFSPLKCEELLVSATPNSQTTSLFRKKEELDRIYNEYNNSKKSPMHNNINLAKENVAKENQKALEKNTKTQDKSCEKNTDEANEYKRLQDKLNVLEKKILSIKSNYDLTLKKNERNSESKKPPIKKNDFVSSSCNFSELAQKEKTGKDSAQNPNPPNVPTHKANKKSLEINNNNKVNYLNPENETSKKSKFNGKEENLQLTTYVNSYTSNSSAKVNYLNPEIETTKKTKFENSPLTSYVTQVKPHSIFPNNVFEDVFQKTLNISEISIKNENSGRETPKNGSHVNKRSTASLVKASVMKLLFKSDIYYLGSVIKAFFYQKSADQELWKEHFHQTIQAILFTKFLKYPDEEVLEAKKLNLAKKDCYKNKKTLIFDLDETLIHCNESSDMESDVILPVKFPNGAVVQAGINLRPGIKECLKELSRHYEIMVFTASHSCYANVVIGFLDPQNEFIQHKLSRENCMVTKEGLYIKDLRILKNRDLKDVLIIDNAAYSFGFQLENGIPILPFYKDKNDRELRSLTNYLMMLKDVQDLREINSEVFKMHQYCEYSDPYELIKSLYSDYIKA